MTGEALPLPHGFYLDLDPSEGPGTPRCPGVNTVEIKKEVCYLKLSLEQFPKETLESSGQKTLLTHCRPERLHTLGPVTQALKIPFPRSTSDC